MSDVVVAGGLIVVAAVAALILSRRGPDAPTQQRWTVPAQLDRRDFAGADAPWLVVAFTSSTCDTCADITRNIDALASEVVAVESVEVGADPARHDRYAIDAVPTVLIADGAGVVRASFVGPVTATDLWATVAELREPGSTPDGCDHGHGHAQD